MGALHGVVAAVHAQLVIDVADVRADRVLGDVKLARDLGAREVGGQQAQNLHLALGKGIDQGSSRGLYG